MAKSYLNILFHLSLLSQVKAAALPQVGPVATAKNGIDDWLSPKYTPFIAPLVISPNAVPKATYTEPINGTVIDYYEIDIREFQAQTVFLPSLLFLYIVACRY